MLIIQKTSRKIFTKALLLLIVAGASGALNTATAQVPEPVQANPDANPPQLLALDKDNDQQPETAASDSSPTDENPEHRCVPEHEIHDWLDGVRVTTHNRLCRSALWIDSRFGNDHKFDDQDFRGKLSVGFREDEKNGFDPRIRVRIKTRLPNVSSRLNAFIGRVDEESYISNTETDANRVNAVGLRSSNADDDEWLIGLGYQKPGHRNNGFDYSVGAKLSHGLSPYAKVTHRHLFKPSDLNYWRTTQTGFWRRTDGFGVSSRLDYTRFLSDHDIIEWDTTVKHTEDSNQWEWITGTTWHHSFSRKTGVSSRFYVRGEEKNEVAIPEYGVTFTYVRPFLKPWLYIETGVDLRFEKEYKDSSYDSVIRLGIEIEMLLGDFYGRE